MSSTASQLSIARQSYAAAIVGCVTFGIYVVLAGICLHYLIQRSRQSGGQAVTLGYTLAMLIVSIIYFTCACKWSEIEFVESTVDPGVFATLTGGSALTILKDTATTVNWFLADSLLLYRAYIIWGKNWLVVVFPIIIYLGSLATGIGFLTVSAEPTASFGQQSLVGFGTSFYAISVGLNVLTTLLISGRLLYHQSKMRKMGQSGSYSGIAAILVESASLYSICGLIYIPLFALNLDTQFAFAALLGSATVIAPNLIILRMALGVAVDENHTAASTNMRFSKGTPGRSTGMTSGSRTFQGSAWSTNKSEQTLPTHVVELNEYNHKSSSME